MIIRTLGVIGTYFLYLISGILFDQCIGHLRLATAVTTETLKSLKSMAFSPFMAMIVSTHLGNAVYGLILLALGTFILLLLKYEFKLKLSTLFIFLGFSLNYISLALVFDRV